MKAVVTRPDGRSEVTDMPPPVGKGGLLLKTIACGLCGTDLLKIRGRNLPAPTVLGHEYVGIVAEVDRDIAGFRAGDRVVATHHVPCGDCHYCRSESPTMCRGFRETNFRPGGFAELVQLSPEHARATAHVLPEGLPWEEAIFTEPLACCLRNFKRVGFSANDTAGIVGLGSIGLMTAALLAARGVNVIGADPDPSRRGASPRYGVVKAFADSGAAFKTALLELSRGRGADAVVFTAGSARLLDEGLSCVRDGGTLNLFSELAGGREEVDVAALYHREVRVIPTYSASPGDVREAFGLLKTGSLRMRDMLEQIYTPETFNAAVEDVLARRVLKAAIRFGG